MVARHAVAWNRRKGKRTAEPKPRVLTDSRSEAGDLHRRSRERPARAVPLLWRSACRWRRRRTRAIRRGPGSAVPRGRAHPPARRGAGRCKPKRRDTPAARDHRPPAWHRCRADRCARRRRSAQAGHTHQARRGARGCEAAVARPHRGGCAGRAGRAGCGGRAGRERAYRPARRRTCHAARGRACCAVIRSHRRTAALTTAVPGAHASIQA
jgi:hypothetical protein